MTISFSLATPVPIYITDIEATGNDGSGSVVKFSLRLGTCEQQSDVSFFDLPCHFWTKDVAIFQQCQRNVFYKAILDGTIYMKDGAIRGRARSMTFLGQQWEGPISNVSVNVDMTGRVGNIRQQQTKSGKTMVDGSIKAESEKVGDDYESLWIDWRVMEEKPGYGGAVSLMNRLSKDKQSIAAVTVRGRLTGDGYHSKKENVLVQKLLVWADGFSFHFSPKEWGGGQGQGQGQSRSSAAPTPTIAPGPVAAPGPSLPTPPVSNTPGGYDEIPF